MSTTYPLPYAWAREHRLLLQQDSDGSILWAPPPSADALGLQGDEVFTIHGITALNDGVAPREVEVEAVAADGRTVEFTALVRIDTPIEVEYYRHGGILQYVLRSLL